MKKIVYTIVTGLLILVTACSSLDQYPLNGPSSDTYLNDESELRKALYSAYSANSAYTPSSSNYGTWISLDAATDIAFERNSQGLPDFVLGNADAITNYAPEIWKQADFTINKCNYLLNNMHRAQNNVTSKVYANIEAQARVIRAYTYHKLIEFYGGVPLVTTMIDLKQAIMPRSSKADIVDFILKELDESVEYLSVQSADKGEITRAVALGIKARTALYNEKWEIAAEAAKSIINMGIYVLNDDFSELFTYAGKDSQEIIWAFQYLKAAKTTHATCRNFGSRNGKGGSSRVPTQSLVDAYQCVDGKDIDKSDMYDPENPYENRDPRLAYTIALPGSIFMGYQFETHKDSVQCWNYREEIPIRIKNEDATNAYATFTGYCWRKYVDPADWANPIESELHQIMLRYAEVLLIYAEAKIEANKIDQSVYDAINKVRQRPSVNMPPLSEGLSQAELRSAVRKERLYELAGEGLRLFDIRRWRIAENVLNGPLYGRPPRGLLSTAPTIDENGIPDYSNVPNREEMRVVEVRKFNKDENRDYLWPIPQREITANPALIQNPGY